jgi:8-oxo-dGTP diphosphatase
MSAPRTHLTTLIYPIHDDAVVLLRRRQPPNLGLWSPPGGKIEPGESPLAAALRELAEETGLRGRMPRLAAVVSELDEVRHEAWLMFVFRVDVADPTLRGDHREGEPQWVKLATVDRLPTPPADRAILEAVLSPGVTFLTVRFQDGQLAGVQAARLPG